MAATSSVLMASAMGMNAAASLGGAYSQSMSLQAQGDYQRRQADTNARFAEMQAEDSLKRGDQAAAAQKRKGDQALGSQRASMAAQGIALDSGSALQIQQQTAEFSAIDAQQIKANAWREAWGLRVQASNSRAEGEYAQAAAQNQARNTLLSGGMQAIGYGLQSYGYAKGAKIPGKES